MKYCKDCKHFNCDTYPVACCLKTEEVSDMVFGQPTWLEARNVRANEEQCGKDAKWFEERPKTIDTPHGPDGLKVPWWMGWFGWSK